MKKLQETLKQMESIPSDIEEPMQAILDYQGDVDFKDFTAFMVKHLGHSHAKDLLDNYVEHIS